MNYSAIFTLPQWADFTLYHMKKPFKCNSSILSAISPVIKNLDQKSFDLPPIKGSLNEVFRAILSFGNYKIDSESIILLFAVVITLDIERKKIIQSLNDKSIDPKHIYSLTNELLSHNVPIKDIIPIIASNIDYYIQFFAHNISYESFTSLKLNFYGKVFANRNISSKDSHNLIKFVCFLYKTFPEAFNKSITNIAKKYFNKDIFIQLLDLQTYDLNQIKDTVLQYISQEQKLESFFNSIPIIPLEYHKRGSELNGVFNYFQSTNSINNSVELTSSSKATEDSELNNLLIRNDDQNYNRAFSTEAEITSIIFDLIGFMLKPSAYAMGSSNNVSNGTTPVSWKLEASIDGEDNSFSWILLDEVKDSNRLCTNNSIEVMPLSECFQAFTKFRITLMKSNGSNGFTLSRFELFGELIKIS